MYEELARPAHEGVAKHRARELSVYERLVRPDETTEEAPDVDPSHMFAALTA
jgi:hypothetical protein